MARTTRNAKKAPNVETVQSDNEAEFDDDDSGDLLQLGQPSPPSPPTLGLQGDVLPSPPSPPTIQLLARPVVRPPPVGYLAPTTPPHQEVATIPNRNAHSPQVSVGTPPGKRKKVTIYGFTAGGKVKLYRTKKAAQKYESEWGAVIDTRNTFTSLDAALKWKESFLSKGPATPDAEATKTAPLDTSNMSPEDTAKLNATLNRVQSRAPKNTIKLIVKMAPGSNAAAVLIVFQGRNGQDVWYLKGKQLSLALSSFFMDFPIEDNPTVQKALVWMKAAQKKDQETRSAASMGSPKNKKQKRAYDEHYAWTTIMVDDRSEMQDEYYRDFVANTAGALGETVKKTMSSDIFMQVYEHAVESEKLWGT